ncbi:uncharacterized protein [Rutidosis leptorrhynchoides]|uniref:uncharacterized protein n=1 Tax=Rutidosis leptorrhynchoides TaxID=125765 RepID=UPI003A9937C9
MLESSAAGAVCRWDWCREPSGRTGTEFRDLLSTLDSVSVDESATDSWKWVLDANGIFTVQKLVDLIDAVVLPRDTVPIETIKNPLVPQKVKVFVWQARRGRIPVRLELDKRGIDLHSTRCPIYDDDLESVEHVLFSCRFAKDIWGKVLNWWGYSSGNFNYGDIFCGTFGSYASDGKKIIWQALC